MKHPQHKRYINDALSLHTMLVPCIMLPDIAVLITIIITKPPSNLMQSHSIDLDC